MGVHSEDAKKFYMKAKAKHSLPKRKQIGSVLEFIQNHEGHKYWMLQHDLIMSFKFRSDVTNCILFTRDLERNLHSENDVN